MPEPKSPLTSYIPPDTWTQIGGTDLEVIVRGVGSNVELEFEHFKNGQGEEIVQVVWRTASGEAIAIRAPRRDEGGR